MTDLLVFQDILGWTMTHGSYLAGVCLAIYYTYSLSKQAYYYVNDKKSEDSLVDTFIAIPAMLTLVFYVVLGTVGIYVAALQWLGLILALTIVGICGILRVARGVVRLKKKKLDAHTNDKDAHKE